MCLWCLPGGVGYVRPEYRNAKRLVFDTRPIGIESLAGEYDVVYLSIESCTLRDVSSTAKGSLKIFLQKCDHDERSRVSSTGMAAFGMLNLDHPAFQQRSETIHTFSVFDPTLPVSSAASFSRESRSFLASHVHELAPETTWHAPGGDVYTFHGQNMFGSNGQVKPGTYLPGKLKLIKDVAALPLTYPHFDNDRSHASVRVEDAERKMALFKDVSDYWLCQHLCVPEDVGRLIRQYLTPCPILYLMPGDLFLVTASMNTNDDWDEQIIIGRKK